ncbi:MAG: vWA domain-containing protein [Bacteroides sp.]|nr:vWA domain-containing protein [Bacteroides sp.]
MNTTRNITKTLLLLIGLFGLASCNSDDNEPTQAQILQNAEGIIPLTSSIGNWDAAYLTKLGYFCYSEDAGLEVTDGKYSSVTYMTADGSDIVSLLSTKSENIPTQMVTKGGIVYFSFPNDSILELIYDNGTTVTMLDSIAYSKEDLPGLGSAYSTDAFKAALANTASLLNNNSSTRSTAKETTTLSLYDAYGSVFEEISNEPYVQDDEIVDEIITNESGNYQFTETIDNWYDDEVKENVSNVLTLWTGKASYKVGGSSCTLSGTIWCSSNIYNEYGTYGILCDESASNLSLGNAEYEGTGYQDEDDLSYSVDFRGFKPNTTYYYKAYYEFNDSNHGGIIPKYGNSTDQVIYDTTVKSFTTGDNILTVDVVMCIDVTGSMYDIINTVKKNAIGFYDSFNACCVEEGIQLSSLNAQVIAFRDKNEDYNWLETSATYSLPTQQAEFNSFVNNLEADGGGDTPESGLEALQAAFQKNDWGTDDGYHRQVVILWTDAPYLIGSYSDVSLSSLEELWNAMPSGRRLILFAPYGTVNSNGESWGELDGWKNLIHEDDLINGFNNFEYILQSIIGELTSRSARTSSNKTEATYFFCPNN